MVCKITRPRNVWRQLVTCDRGAEGEVEVGSVAALGAQRRSDAADGFFALGMLKKQQQLCPGCFLKSALVG